MRVVLSWIGLILLQGTRQRSLAPSAMWEHKRRLLWIMKWALTRCRIWWHLDLGLTASRTLRNNVFLSLFLYPTQFMILCYSSLKGLRQYSNILFWGTQVLLFLTTYPIVIAPKFHGNHNQIYSIFSIEILMKPPPKTDSFWIFGTYNILTFALHTLSCSFYGLCN